VNALQKDPYHLVRRAAAYSLGLLGKHSVSAVPVLIDGIAKQDEYVGYMCARALGEISKATLGRTQEFGYDPTMNKKQRREIQEKWNEWWQKNKTLIQPSMSR
jgi:HEAT repeat protein